MSKRITVTITIDIPDDVQVVHGDSNIQLKLPDDETIPTEAQRFFLEKRGRFTEGMTRKEAHKLIGEIKEEEEKKVKIFFGKPPVRHFSFLDENDITTEPANPLPWEEQPVKRKRGRPRKAVV